MPGPPQSAGQDLLTVHQPSDVGWPSTALGWPVTTVGWPSTAVGYQPPSAQVQLPSANRHRATQDLRPQHCARCKTVHAHGLGCVAWEQCDNEWYRYGLLRPRSNTKDRPQPLIGQRACSGLFGQAGPRGCPRPGGQPDGLDALQRAQRWCCPPRAALPSESHVGHDNPKP